MKTIEEIFNESYPQVNFHSDSLSNKTRQAMLETCTTVNKAYLEQKGSVFLTPTSGYELSLSVSDREEVSKGIYISPTIAHEDGRGKGWYGSNGSVRTRNDVYVNSDGILYTIKPLGKFMDVERLTRAEMIKGIKEKLSPEELEFLRLK